MKNVLLETENYTILIKDVPLEKKRFNFLKIAKQIISERTNAECNIDTVKWKIDPKIYESYWLYLLMQTFNKNVKSISDIDIIVSYNELNL